MGQDLMWHGASRPKTSDFSMVSTVSVGLRGGTSEEAGSEKPSTEARASRPAVRVVPLQPQRDDGVTPVGRVRLDG